jgi:hypothetical protein
MQKGESIHGDDTKGWAAENSVSGV